MATQTLTFSFADIEGSAAMVRRSGGAYAEDSQWLIRAGLAGYGR